MVGPEAPLAVRMLVDAHDERVSSVWQQANLARREVLGMSVPPVAPPALGRDGWFGAGIFDDDLLVSVAIAMPARADDGRSLLNVPGLAHISTVATLPQRWGRGLALHAVRAARSLAVRRGYARCQLWTHASNSRAQALYAGDGFTASGRHKVDDFGEEIVHLVRDLTTPPPIQRAAARIACADRSGRILMMHWRDPYDGYQLWEPPGGGVEEGEDDDAAAVREWQEETGLAAPELLGATTVGRDQIWAGGRVVTDETFYLARLDEDAPAPRAAGFTDVEHASYLGHAWMTRGQIAAMSHDGDPIEPDLVPVLARLDA
jgi:8-oxo-dGTP pyrophosphatase MutT (NUDIX family)/ribosomal protein S18 acetylase RimI-like enzyme